ncbi:hypothetical protein P3S68_013042 [Capsicum galapagoense]
MNNLERSWMYERLDGRGGLYSRFVIGVDEFIQFASSQPNRMGGDKVRCPCAKCQNYKFMDVETVKCHLYQFGFIENYFIWKHQGERDDISETSYGNAFHGSGQPIFEENPYRQMILHAVGPNFSQGSSWQPYSNSEPESSHPFQHSMEENPNPVSKKFYDLLDAADAKLYSGSSLSQLAVASRMLNIKIENNNMVLDNYYQTKKLVRSLGLLVEKIDCCESGCMLYWGDDDENLISCKFYSKPRYKCCVGSRKRKLIPYKRILQHGRKQSWFDCHRMFLDQHHPFRRDLKNFFKGQTVRRPPPTNRTGEEILDQICNLGIINVTDLDAEQVNKIICKTCGWKKRSIFWDLPYWSFNMIRHNLDIIHIEKSFFDNDSNDQYPKAVYTLDKEARAILFNWVKCLKFPDGYVSNLGRLPNANAKRLFGMKSYDCHVFMQRLMPIAFRELLPSNVWQSWVL